MPANNNSNNINGDDAGKSCEEKEVNCLWVQILCWIYVFSNLNPFKSENVGL